MEQNAAAENLQVIRTLMERSALYRRTLAPVMTFAGLVGLVAAVMGWATQISSGSAFMIYWLVIAGITLVGVSLLVRRQALKDGEPFLSPPTRRVSQAAALPLSAGLAFSLILLAFGIAHMRWLFIFPSLFFYACALHAAGFFMVRGIRCFAWILIVLGAVSLLGVARVLTDPNSAVDHGLMGFFFGFLHLAYGAYLYVTEKRKTAA